MIKLLFIDDNVDLGAIIKLHLESVIGGYNVVCFSSGKAGLAYLETNTPDVIVADIEMPEMDGLEMVKKIRETDRHIPIFFATARTSSEQVKIGINVGANYYIKKPFDGEELDAHIRGFLNQHNGVSIFWIGKYNFNPKNSTLTIGKDVKQLTDKESDILLMLYEGQGKLVSKKDILMKHWGQAEKSQSGSLDNFITKLRKYLSEDKSVKLNVVHGRGWILDW